MQIQLQIIKRYRELIESRQHEPQDLFSIVAKDIYGDNYTQRQRAFVKQVLFSYRYSATEVKI